MKTWSKTVGIGIGVFAAGLIILAVSLFSYARSDHFRQMILKRINASIAGNLMLARHDISFLQGRIVLENLTVISASGHRLAALDYLSADIAWLSLLKRTIDIQSMVLNNPDIRIQSGQDGTLDIAEAFKAPSARPAPQAAKKPGSPLAVVVRNARVTGGHVYWVDEPDHLHLDLKQITIQARVDLIRKTGALRLQVADTAVTHGGRHLNIRPLSASVVLTENRPLSVALSAKTDFAEIALAGDVRQVFGDPVLNLELAFNASMAESKELMILPHGYSGMANGNITVQGSWRDPDVDLDLTYNDGSLAGYPVKALRADLSLKKRRLLVQQLDILAGSGEIRLEGHLNLQDVFPKGLISSQIHPDKAGYTIKANLKHMDVNFLAKDIDGIQGYLNSKLTIEGQGIDFNKLSASTTIDAVLENFFSKGMHHPTKMQLQASAKLEAGVIDLRQMTMLVAKTRLKALGTVDLTAGSIQATLAADTDNIQNLLSVLGVNGNSGACAVKAEVSGPWKQPHIAIDLNGRQIQSNGIRLGDLYLAAGLNQKGLLEISSLNLENQGTRVQGGGTIQLFKDGFRLHESMPVAGRLTLIQTQIQDFLDDGRVGGTFDGDLQLDGSVYSPQAAALLRGRDLAYKETPLGDIDADIRFVNGGFLLNRLHLENQGASFILTGGIRVFEPNSWHRLAAPVIDLDIQGQDIAIEAFLQDIKGKLFLKAHIEGPTSSLKGQGTIEGKQLDVNGQGVERVALDIELQENRLHISMLEAFVDPGGVVNGTGWIDLDQRFSFDLHSTDLQLNTIDKIREMEKVAGKADFHVWGEGSLKDPAVYGDIHVRSVQVNGEEMDDFRFRIELVHNQLSVKGHQTFELNLDYHLSNRDFSIDLLFVDTEVAPFLLATGTKDVGGRLSGKVVAKGNTAFLEKSEALLDISMLSLTYRGDVLAHTDKVQGELRNQQLSIPVFQLNFLKSGQLQIRGFGNLDGAIELTADGNIPAKAAMPFFEDITDVEGDIRLHAEIKGSAEKPVLSGEIQLDDVGCSLTQIDISLKGVNGKIQLTSSQIATENLTGNLNTGLFEIQGAVALENFRPDSLQLQVKTHTIPIRVPETMEVVIDADLTAAGPLKNLTLEGDIVILEGVYYKNVKANLFQDTKEKKQIEDLPAKNTKPTLFDQITTRIQLKYREPFMVDNNIAHLEIQPDLVLSGTLDDPVITGIAKVGDGTLHYQNKTFVVERGIVNFMNPYKIEPEIDILGNIQIRQWRISLMMSGTPDRLVVELISTPSEEDADILSLLVFGKTTDEMRGTNDGGIETTEALLAKVMASSFGGDIKEATGLDYLEVETNPEESERDSDTIQVTVGKDLTERMTVKYTIESGKNGYQQRTATEYKLIEYILLSGFQDIEGNYGGEIIFRVEFRMFQ